MSRVAILMAACLGGSAPMGRAQTPVAKPQTMADILAASKPSDWRPLDPENTLYLELTSGRVVIELAPAFAPRHVANVKALVREGYFNGLAIVRSQDNYVVQWGDPDAGDVANLLVDDLHGWALADQIVKVRAFIEQPAQVMNLGNIVKKENLASRVTGIIFDLDLQPQAPPLGAIEMQRNLAAFRCRPLDHRL
jgi:hypothetical protein